MDASALVDTAPPLRLVWHDVKLLLSSSYLVPLLIVPLNIPHQWIWEDVQSLIWQGFLLFYANVVIVLLSIVLFFGIFGAFFPTHAVYTFIIFTGIVAIFKILKREVPPYVSEEGTDIKGETWIYVNGVCCNETWLRQNCETLASAFGRRIHGVYNRTFGPVFDILESIIQRDFRYTTDDVRQLYTFTRDELRKNETKKVVLIAHSQGGILASLVVDRLLDSTTHSELSKLEVYTFGSAANHMYGRGIIYCEHFANSKDFFARTGVLAYHGRKQVLRNKEGSDFKHCPFENEYNGYMYENDTATGHLLDMHYLPVTFLKGSPGENSRLAQYLHGSMPSPFLVPQDVPRRK